MKYQDYIIESTKEAFEAAFKYARHVKPDKLEWKPLDEGRTVMNILHELTKCPDWAVEIMSSTEPPSFSEESMAAYEAEKSEWTSVEKCYEIGKAKLAKFVEFVAAFPDDKLKDTKWLPFDGGRDFTNAEQMGYPLWNYSYHQGQIAYIETLYGDKEMP